MNNNTKQDNWEECPRCGSNRVTTMGKGIMFMLMMFLSSGTLVIGIIFPPLWLATIAFFLIGFTLLFIPNVKMNVCKDCNKSWKPNK